LGIGVGREVKFLVSSWSEGETLLTGAAGRIREARYWEVNSRFAEAPSFMVFPDEARS
jgi:hypothetical protein